MADTLITILAVVLIAPFLWIGIRATSARLMTGAWPHQSAESLRVYRSLP